MSLPRGHVLRCSKRSTCRRAKCTGRPANRGVTPTSSRQLVVLLVSECSTSYGSRNFYQLRNKMAARRRNSTSIGITTRQGPARPIKRCVSLRKQIVKIPLRARINRDLKTAPFDASEEVFESGAHIYHEQCAVCHGTPGHDSPFTRRIVRPGYHSGCVTA
jgi:hypothetical protein